MLIKEKKEKKRFNFLLFLSFQLIYIGEFKIK